MSEKTLTAAQAAWKAYHEAERSGADPEELAKLSVAVGRAMRAAQTADRRTAIAEGRPPRKYDWEAEEIGLDEDNPSSVVGWAVNYVPENTARGVELEWKAGRILLENPGMKVDRFNGSKELPELTEGEAYDRFCRRYARAAKRYRQLGYIPPAILRRYVEKDRAEYTRAGLIQFARQNGIDVPTQSGKPRKQKPKAPRTLVQKIAAVESALWAAATLTVPEREAIARLRETLDADLAAAVKAERAHRHGLRAV